MTTYQFLGNKYRKWYFKIIQHARDHLNTVGERHHIVPRSLGGSNDEANLVLLSYRQHFICHRLLTKMTAGTDRSKMAYAFLAMCMNHRTLFNSYTYDYLKRAVIAAWSDEEFRSHQSEIRKKIWSDPELLARHSAISKSKWTDEKREEFAKAIAEAWQRPDYRDTLSESRRAMWQDPEFQQRMSQTHKELWQTEKHRSTMQIRDERHKQLWKDPEYRERQRKSRSASWTPERKAAHAEKISKKAAEKRAAKQALLA